MSFPIKILESRCMGMHLAGFEGCPLAALWYVNMKVFFVALFFSKAANLHFIEMSHKHELLRG